MTVVLSVPAAGAAGGSSVQPAGLLFTGTPGAADPPAQNITLSTNTTAGTKFGASVVFGDGRPWFAFQPSSGTVQPNVPLTIAVKPAINGFANGVYNAVITVAFDDNTTQQVNLLLVVSAGSAGAAKPGGIRRRLRTGKRRRVHPDRAGFSAIAGWPAPVEVRSWTTAAIRWSGILTAAFSNNDPALTLNSLLDGRWTAPGRWETRAT